MRLRAGFLLLVFFACKGGSGSSNEGTATGDDASGGDDAGVEAEAQASAPPLDCSADDADWPFYGHDVCNTRAPTTAGGISTQTAAKLTMKWTYAAGGEVSATPAVVGGQVYVPDWGGSLARLDAATGTVAWSKQVAELAGFGGEAGAAPDAMVSRVTPAVANGTVVFGVSRTGFSAKQSLAYVIAVDTSGAPMWKTLVDDHPAAVITSSPVIENGKVYVGVSSLEEAVAMSSSYECCTFRGSVVALDASSGAILWKTPMIDDGTFFQSDGKTPAGIAGAAVWSGTPTIDRHRHQLYVTTGNNYVMPSGVTAAPAGDHVESIVALDMDTGAIKWAQAMTTNDVWTFGNMSGPDFDFGCGANLFQATIDGVTRDLVGAGQKSGIYWAVDPDTGEVVWKTQVGPGGHLGGIHWGTAFDGTRIVLGENDTNGMAYALGGTGAQAGQMVTTGSWAALDPATGNILWHAANPAMSQPLGGASVNGPVTVVGGVALVGSMDSKGTMYALDATSGAVLWSFQSGGTVYGGPAVVGGMVFWGSGYPVFRLGFGTSSKKLYAFAAP